MAAPLTLSASELSSIKRLAYAVGGTNDGGSRADLSEAALKETRREASRARASQWPNTLAGLRRRKEEAKQQRLEKAEEEALELDKVMAEERLSERLTIIRAANDYFAGQSDKVKALRNYQQQQADRESNEANISLRARRSAAESAVDNLYHEKMMAEVAAGEKKDAGGRAVLRAKAKFVAADIKEQVKAVFVKKIAEKKEEEDAAMALLADIEAQEREAAAAVVAKRQHAAAATKAFALENIKMAASRTDAKKEEADLDARVAAEAARNERRTATIKSIISGQHKEAERKAKVISDLVSEFSELFAI